MGGDYDIAEDYRGYGVPFGSQVSAPVGAVIAKGWYCLNPDVCLALDGNGIGARDNPIYLDGTTATGANIYTDTLSRRNWRLLTASASLDRLCRE